MLYIYIYIYILAVVPGVARVQEKLSTSLICRLMKVIFLITIVTPHAF